MIKKNTLRSLAVRLAIGVGIILISRYFVKSEDTWVGVWVIGYAVANCLIPQNFPEKCSDILWGIMVVGGLCCSITFLLLGAVNQWMLPVLASGALMAPVMRAIEER